MACPTPRKLLASFRPPAPFSPRSLNGGSSAAIYAMIFRRLRSLGADWAYHFPQLYLAELGPRDPDDEQAGSYSVSESAAAEVNAQTDRADLARFRAEVDEANARAREAAMDREPPATVRAYRQVYGHDPRGWPPA